MKRGKFTDALPLAERGLTLRTTANVSASLVAESKYFVAQALWGAGKDRAKALVLVREARAAYVAAGAGREADVREVDRWLVTKKP
jgi:predicted transcriptional regulator